MPAAGCIGLPSQKVVPTALPGRAGSAPAGFVAVVTSAVVATIDCNAAAVAEVVAAAAADGETAVAVAAGHAASCWSELEREADLQQVQSAVLKPRWHQSFPASMRSWYRAQLKLTSKEIGNCRCLYWPAYFASAERERQREREIQDNMYITVE